MASALGLLHPSRNHRLITRKLIVRIARFKQFGLVFFMRSRLQNKALVVANEIMNTFRSGDASDIRRCRKLAETVFGENWQDKGEAIYEGDKQAQIWGIGQYVFYGWKSMFRH